jgi:hypothetical protein
MRLLFTAAVAWHLHRGCRGTVDGYRGCEESHILLHYYSGMTWEESGEERGSIR